MKLASRSLQKMVRYPGACGWTRPSRTVVVEVVLSCIAEFPRPNLELDGLTLSHPLISSLPRSPDPDSPSRFKKDNPQQPLSAAQSTRLRLIPVVQCNRSGETQRKRSSEWNFRLLFVSFRNFDPPFSTSPCPMPSQDRHVMPTRTIV